MSTRWKTFWLCLLSSMICGLLLQVGRCYSLFSYSVSSPNVPGQLWYHWVNWLPGIIFGIAFSTLHIRNRLNILIFSLISGVVFLLAGLINVSVLNSVYTMRGVIFGFVFGGLAISLSFNILTQTKLSLEIVFMQMIISFFSGLVVAWLHWLIGFLLAIGGGTPMDYGCPGIQPLDFSIFTSTFVFAVWQVPIGLLLSKSISQQMASQTEQPREDS